MATILFNPEQATDRTEHFAPTSGGHSAALDLRATSSYWWLIGERAAFLLGVYGLQAFGQYYIRDALGLADAPQRTGNVLGIIGLTTILLVVAAGWLTDRHGAKPLLCAASLLAGTGLLLMMLTTDLRGLYGFGALLGAGIGLFLASNWALANQLAPGKGAGKYLGLTNLATAGAAALARLEGPAVDALNQWLPGQWWGYKGVFAFGAMCILFSLWFLLKVQVPAPKRPAQARPPG